MGRARVSPGSDDCAMPIVDNMGRGVAIRVGPFLVGSARARNFDYRIRLPRFICTPVGGNRMVNGAICGRGNGAITRLRVSSGRSVPLRAMGGGPLGIVFRGFLCVTCGF